MDENTLFENIKSTVLNIESDLLELTGYGIYFAPELYVGFCIGREILKSRNEIFGTHEIKWKREVKIENIGLSDLVYEHNRNIHTVIELKLRDTYSEYKKDIKKLMSMSDSFNRYFLVLLDSFTENNDERLTKLESEFTNLKPVDHHPFPTNDTWYGKQVYCNLNLYKIQ